MFPANPLLRTSCSAWCGAALLAASWLSASSPLGAAEPVAAFRDVALAPGGVLHGRAVNAQGAGDAAAPVVLFQNGRRVAHTTADAQGNFSLPGVRGGVYVVASPTAAQVCRMWAPGTAPPAATEGLLLVGDQQVLRGQSFTPRSAYEWFETHPLLGYTLVAAAITIPVVLFYDDDDEPAATQP